MIFVRVLILLMAAPLAGILFGQLPSSADVATAFAEEADDAGIAFFETEIRPVLAKHCYECHSTDAGAAEGGLRVDQREAIRTGGNRGPAIVPNRPEASLLLAAIAHRDPDLQMPPDHEPLPNDVVRDFRKWIEMGAPDPRTEETAGAPRQWRGLEAAAGFWAYQRAVQSPPPHVTDTAWPRDSVDHFILRRLEEDQLRPSQDAEPHILLRRLHFDLIGLPPSPKDLDHFRQACVRDGVDAALVAVVDALLQSPRFGERWGRHWLDVARFGESSGKEANIPFPYAWRYRDYVIDSVNADVPIDRFITEQIAGDLLPHASAEERARLLVATGFLAVGTKNLSESNDKQFEADLVDEQIDSVTRSIIASSIACARCHDHKFDPFAMEDYYALAGIFHSTKTYFGTFVSPASRRGGELLRLPRHDDQLVLHASVTQQRVGEMKQQLAELQAEKAEMNKAQRAMFAGREPEKTFTLRDVLANIWRTGPIVGRLQTIDDRGAAVPVSMGALDDAEPRDAHLLIRGEIDRPAETVPRGFPRALQVEEIAAISPDQSGRLQLAEWLTSREHPLTSRVFVNRVWHHLFGTGLVRTVDDFGTTGQPPSHPQLLDTLALQFVDDGWSLKRLVRRLVLTRTYRQASAFREGAFLEDPENRLLWRMPKRRLPAEAIRDAMLAVSGEIDASRPEGSLVGRVILDKPISLIGLDKRLPEDLDGSLHRSVYLPVIRDRLPDVLELFDFAEPSLVTGSRQQTNVPVQALYLMNSPFVQQRAAAFAARVIGEHDSDEQRVAHAFRLCFAREPDASELQRALAFLQMRSSSEGSAAVSADKQTLSEGGLEFTYANFCQALLCTAEFRNID